MLKRSFELLQLDLNLLTVMNAIRMEDAGELTFTFSYAQSQLWTRIKKSNTIFFEELTKVLHTPYDLTDRRLDFLYDAIFVDMNSIKDKATTFILKKADGSDGLCEKRNDQIKKALFDRGFTITGVPMRSADALRPSRAEADETEDIHYVAFLSSASMARNGLMLFINEAHYDAIIRRLSLDFFRYDTDTHRLRMPTRESPNAEGCFFRPDYKVQAAKYSAYMGLMLSDGVSLKEKSRVWKETYGTEPELPELNEETILVVKDMEVPAKDYYEALGDYAWVIEADGTTPAMENKKKPQLLRKFFSALADTENAAIDRWSAYVQTGLKNISLEELYFDECLPESIADERSAVLWALALLCRRDGQQGRDRDLPMADGLLHLLQDLKTDEKVRNTLQNLMGCPDRFRIDSNENEETSTVFFDGHPLYLSFEKADSSRVFTARLRPSTELRHDLNLFDGMGLCDPQTFDQLEKLLMGKPTPDPNHPITAVIIRLPWLKGVLVKCDFLQFFKDRAGHDLPGRKVTDHFGMERDLANVHIIVPTSMVKGEKYLSNLKCTTEEGGAEELPDPWKYYWDKIRAYDISMVITGKNSKESTAERMNFQFLSTSGLQDSTLDRLCQTAAEDILCDLQAQALRTENQIDPMEAVLDADETAADTEETTEAEPESIRTFEDLLQNADPETVQKLCATGYVRNSAESYARSTMIDCMLGRLPVAGDFRFVAPDLMAMLHYLYDRLIDGDKNPQLKSALNTVDRSGKGHGYFYAPSTKSDLFRKEVACLRNPHIALGETALVSPLPEAEAAAFDRYFSHLNSIIMLPSTAVNTMGGADYDGDRCLVLAEQNIIDDIRVHIEENKAMLRHLIEHREDLLPLLDDCMNSANKPLCRQAAALRAWLDDKTILPKAPEFFFRENICPPLIFGADFGKEKAPTPIGFGCADVSFEEKLYRSFVLTTEQRIGILSLTALDYADRAYHVGVPAANDRLLESLRTWLWHWRTVSLALETGAEIDMAKTGVRCKPAALRENKPVKEDPPFESRQAIYDLFACPEDPLKLFRNRVKEDPSIRQQTGSHFADALEKYMDRLPEEPAGMPHNNVGRIPYAIYRNLEKHLPFGDGRGSNLRTVFYRLLGNKVIREGVELPPAENEEETPFQDIHDPNPITMRSLVWAADHARPKTLADYLNHYLAEEDHLSSVDLPELVGDEQGIYFLKEAAKFMHFSRMTEISNDGQQYMTPDALSIALHEIWGKDVRSRLAYLCTCKKQYFDAFRGKKRPIMDDHLFLALIGNDIGELLKNKPTEEIILDAHLCTASDICIMAYAQGKSRRANHEAAQGKQVERFHYSLKNLQRRYSLAAALEIMQKYSESYENTPLGKLGLPPEKLYHVYTHMEEVKNP